MIKYGFWLRTPMRHVLPVFARVRTETYNERLGPSSFF